MEIKKLRSIKKSNMSREIRRVPANWKHLKRIKKQFHPSEGDRVEEQYRPMHDNTTFQEAVKEFEKSVKEWMEGYELWQKGYYKRWDGEEQTLEQFFKWAMDYIDEERKKYRFGEDYCE